MLVVSAGDDLSGPTVIPEQKRLRAQLVVDAHQAMGCDAMCLGEQDLGTGVDLRKVRGRTLVDRAGVRIGVFSLDCDTDKRPQETLRRQAAALRREGAKLVVALLHGGNQRAKELLSAPGSGVDFAVLSHNGFGNTAAERVGSTWVVEGPTQGKHMGQLDLHILDGNLSFHDSGQRGQLAAQLAGRGQELRDLAARQATAEPRLKEYYDRQRKDILESAERERAQIAEAAEAAGREQASWMENKLVPLGTEVGDEARVAALVKTYKAAVARLPPPPPRVLALRGSGFAGVEACVACHEPAVRFWRKSHHARAWATLVKKKQEHDMACVQCHVTGGMLILPDVQCEACHGPAASHVAQPRVPAMLMRDTPEAVCRTCHTPQQTGAWEFAAFRKAIVGPGHGKR
ncbi:MAG: hypothetical protein EXR72_11140 [Myxococcales bacterium]|nr:hypothetical protein [Myxococcales bacterium]